MLVFCKREVRAEFELSFRFSEHLRERFLPSCGGTSLIVPKDDGSRTRMDGDSGCPGSVLYPLVCTVCLAGVTNRFPWSLGLFPWRKVQIGKTRRNTLKVLVYPEHTCDKIGWICFWKWLNPPKPVLWPSHTVRMENALWKIPLVNQVIAFNDPPIYFSCYPV